MKSSLPSGFLDEIEVYSIQTLVSIHAGLFITTLNSLAAVSIKHVKTCTVSYQIGREEVADFFFFLVGGDKAPEIGSLW